MTILKAPKKPRRPYSVSVSDYPDVPTKFYRSITSAVQAAYKKARRFNAVVEVSRGFKLLATIRGF